MLELGIIIGVVFAFLPSLIYVVVMYRYNTRIRIEEPRYEPEYSDNIVPFKRRTWSNIPINRL